MTITTWLVYNLPVVFVSFTKHDSVNSFEDKSHEQHQKHQIKPGTFDQNEPANHQNSMDEEEKSCENSSQVVKYLFHFLKLQYFALLGFWVNQCIATMKYTSNMQLKLQSAWVH